MEAVGKLFGIVGEYLMLLFLRLDPSLILLLGLVISLSIFFIFLIAFFFFTIAFILQLLSKELPHVNKIL